MIKVCCNKCGWKGDLSSCGTVEVFDAARCPHCATAVVAYKVLQQIREERRVLQREDRESHERVLPLRMGTNGVAYHQRRHYSEVT